MVGEPFRTLSRLWSSLLLAALVVALFALWRAAGTQAPVAAPVAPEPVEQEAREQAPGVEPEESSRGRQELPVPPAVIEIPEPEDPPVEELEEAELPDPVQTGPCALSLRLVDGETWQPLEGTIDLWRLGAPGNAAWTAGDQLQTSVRVPEAGLVIGELPAGQYRARCYQEAHLQEDPPAFSVEGPWTEVVLPIRLPRSYPVSLRVYDEHGHELRQAVMSGGLANHIWKTVEEPSWRQARQPTDPGLFVESFEEWSGLSWGRVDRWEPIEAGADGFLLGELDEDGREATAHYNYRLRFPGRNEVLVSWTGGPHRAWSFEAVAWPRELLLAQLVPSDGRLIAEVQEGLVLEAEAMRAETERPGQTWAQVPVRIRLNGNPRYVDFDARFRWQERPWPVHRLPLRSGG